MGMMVYDNIGLLLPYSGNVAIGKDFVPGERHWAFLGFDSYDRVLNLTFQDGVLTGIENVPKTDPED